MTSFHMPHTGSQCSVGPRRTCKEYTFRDGTKVVAKSAAGARRALNRLNEAPVLVSAVNCTEKSLGTVTPAPPATVVTRGSPGTFTGVTPESLTALQALGALGQTTAWNDAKIGTLQEWVVTADGERAVWRGADRGWEWVGRTQTWSDAHTLIMVGPSGWPNATVPASLADLKADPQAGDGKGYTADGYFGTAENPGVDFATGQSVTLLNGDKGYFNSGVWLPGKAP
jgi:hypothetical protein